jgi:hypothetical protein
MIKDNLFAPNVSQIYILLLHKERENMAHTFHQSNSALIKDIFPLGCSDQTFCDHRNFPLCFSVNCAHSHLTALPVNYWLVGEVVRVVSQTMTHHNVAFVFLSSEHVFPEVLTWSTTKKFALVAVLQWKVTVPCSKKQGPMSVAFH